MAIVVTTKWRITVTFAATQHVLWVYDQHLANVLRQLASLQFTENGLEQPSKVVVTREGV